ncbi:MAG TPA: FkbM family methyltransferase [Pyrinomonadaceae bacterium]|nr:FkbM family methyltransferase [Pyrinomonadaceae bacterium]
MLSTIRFIVEHPLNRRHKISAIRRWLNWQIGSRLVPGPVAVNFVNKTKLLVACGMTGATGNVYAGLHEFYDMAFALHLLRRDDIFVDVGANVGVYTVLASSVEAKSISIEPIKDAFDQLMLNVHLNDICDRVDARQVGVGSKKGTLKFTNALDTTNHVVDGKEAIATAVCEVNVDTLDGVVAAADPLLVKIDVEGFETEVIAGANDVLSKKSLLAVIMELNGSGQRYNHDEDEVYKRMIEYGFASYNYDPYQRSLKELNGKNPSAGNTLFIRDVAAVRERLQAAPAFTVMGESL